MDKGNFINFGGGGMITINIPGNILFGGGAVINIKDGEKRKLGMDVLFSGGFFR